MIDRIARSRLRHIIFKYSLCMIDSFQLDDLATIVSDDALVNAIQEGTWHLYDDTRRSWWDAAYCRKTAELIAVWLMLLDSEFELPDGALRRIVMTPHWPLPTEKAFQSILNAQGFPVLCAPMNARFLASRNRICERFLFPKLFLQKRIRIIMDSRRKDWCKRLWLRFIAETEYDAWEPMLQTTIPYDSALLLKYFDIENAFGNQELELKPHAHLWKMLRH